MYIQQTVKRHPKCNLYPGTGIDFPTRNIAKLYSFQRTNIKLLPFHRAELLNGARRVRWRCRRTFAQFQNMIQVNIQYTRSGRHNAPVQFLEIARPRWYTERVRQINKSYKLRASSVCYSLRIYVVINLTQLDAQQNLVKKIHCWCHGSYHYHMSCQIFCLSRYIIYPDIPIISANK